MKNKIFYIVSIVLLPAMLLINETADAQKDSTTLYDLPFRSSELKAGFNILGSSSVCLPVKGGIYDASLGAWLISPESKMSIINFDYNMADTSLIFAACKDSSSIVLLKGKSNSGSSYIQKRFGTLPAGNCFISVVGNDSFFAWHYDREFSSIYLFSDSQHLLLQTKDTITAFYPAGPTALLFAVNKKLYSLTAGDAPKLFTVFDDIIDGIAQNDSGSLIVSTQKGIYTFTGNSKKIVLLTNETHGYLRAWSNSLYVFDRSRNKIVQFGL